MILVMEGTVRIEGETSVVMSEFTLLIRNMLGALEEHYGKASALEKVAECGRLACMSEDELTAEVVERIAELEADGVPEELKDIVESVKESMSNEPMFEN